jgi:hypothetical protein
LGTPSLCVIDESTDLIGYLDVTKPGLARSDLHRNRKKFPFVPMKVTLEQCNDVSGAH